MNSPIKYFSFIFVTDANHTNTICVVKTRQSFARTELSIVGAFGTNKNGLKTY